MTTVTADLATELRHHLLRTGEQAQHRFLQEMTHPTEEIDYPRAGAFAAAVRLSFVGIRLLGALRQTDPVAAEELARELTEIQDTDPQATTEYLHAQARAARLPQPGTQDADSPAAADQ